MKKIIIQFLLFILFFQLHVIAQQVIDEEKVKKAVTLQKKMMQNPGEMMSIMEEIKVLKLNSAEDKEVRNRMTKAAGEMITAGKEQVAKMGGVSEEQVKKSMEEKQRILPVKDAARINAVLKRTLADAEIKNYCKAVHEAVKKKLDPKIIEQSEKFYREIQSKHSSAGYRGNGAISCYLTNLTLQSIYIMGRVCSEESYNANNLNNYAALLTNHGVEQGAIPLLNYLNKKYGRDPFVFSNLAVAWMGLGELISAEKYADSCIRFFPGQSHQAHYVKSIVEESKGNRQGAVNELKQSIGQVFSAEKESQLRKWGGKMESNYHKRHLPADALGLSKFNYPTIPKSCEDVFALSEDWKGFYKELDMVIKGHEAKTKRLEEAVNQSSKKQAQQMMEKVKAARTRPGYYFAANNNQNMGWWNLFNTLTNEYSLKEEEYSQEFNELLERDKVLKEQMHKSVEQLSEKYENTCGEGEPCPSEEICNAHKKVYDTYLGEINPLLDGFYQKFISFKRRSVNELVYAAKYCLPEAEYERFKNDRQLNFLRELRNVSYRVWDIFPDFGGEKHACMKGKPNPFKSKGLQRFEDIHCPPDWDLKIPGGSGVSTHCTKITLKLGFGVGEASYTEDLLTNEWTNMTLEIGYEIGTKDIKGIEVGAEAGAFIEIDRQGISDYGVKGKAGISNGVVNAEAEGKLSLMSGKAAFDTKAGSALNTVMVAFK